MNKFWHFLAGNDPFPRDQTLFISVFALSIGLCGAGLLFSPFDFSNDENYYTVWVLVAGIYWLCATWLIYKSFKYLRYGIYSARASAAQLRLEYERDMKRVGVDPETAPVLLSGLALLVYYQADSKPNRVYNQRLTQDIHYLRPLLELRCQEPQKALIRIELMDDEEQVVFAEDFETMLQENTQLVTQTWYDVRAYDFNPKEERAWALHIWVNGARLAKHFFQWDQINLDSLSVQSLRDGEISEKISQKLGDGQTSLSLDDLLVKID